MEFAVLGAGSWGIALSNLLVRNGLDVQLWHYNKKTLDSLTINHGLHFDNTSNFSLSSSVNIVHDKNKRSCWLRRARHVECVFNF